MPSASHEGATGSGLTMANQVATAAIIASSSVTAQAVRNRTAHATMVASSLLSNSAFARLLASATVTAAATITHQARAAIVASSALSVTARGATYFAVATGPTRVRCIFGIDVAGHIQTFPMTVNVALTNPSSYTLTDFNGNVVSITNVQIEQLPPGSVYSVVLTLGTALATYQWYLTTLSAGILDSSGQPLETPTSTFQWVLPIQTTTVPLWEFSEPPLMPGPPPPPGVVFFSPSLNVAAPNSIIQVEDVSVCTTAYDQYRFPPQIIDPSPFYVWGPPSPVTTLNTPDINTGLPAWVLFAGFPFLSEASFNLSFGYPASPLLEPMPEFYNGLDPITMEPVYSAAFDGSCSVNLAQEFAPGYVSLLNNLAWILDGGLAGLLTVSNGFPTVATTASQVGVVQNGDTLVFDSQPGVQYTVLSVAPTLVTLTTNYAGTSSSTAMGYDLTVPPLFICANNRGPIPPGADQIIVLHQAIVGYATMTVQEPALVHWAQVNIHGDSSLATAPMLSPTAIKANSYMRVARPHLSLGATVNMVGEATVTVQTIGGQDLEATADIVGYATVDGHVEMDWLVTTAIEATSSIFTRSSRHQKIAATALGNSLLAGFATKGPIGAAALHGGSSMAAHATVDHPVRATISGISALNAVAT